MPEHDYSNVDWKTLIGKECTFIGSNGRRITFTPDDWDLYGQGAVQLYGGDHAVRSDRSRLVRIHGDGPAGVAAVVPEPPDRNPPMESYMQGNGWVRLVANSEQVLRFNPMEDEYCDETDIRDLRPWNGEQSGFELISSLGTDGFQHPIFDVDQVSPNFERVGMEDFFEFDRPNLDRVWVGSTTNWHLYMGRAAPFETYRNMLRLANMQSGWTGNLGVHGQTFLRPWFLRKPPAGRLIIPDMTQPPPTPSDDASLLLGLPPFDLEEAIARYNEINDRLSEGAFA